METLQLALEPYRHLDPVGWVRLSSTLGWPGGLAAAAVGLLFLLRGGRRLFRLVAAVLGVLLAAVWASELAGRLGLGAEAGQVTLIAAAALLGLGLLAPATVVFCAFGIPGGLLAGWLVGPPDWMLSFPPGFMAGGAVGVALQRPVEALLAAALGAWALVLGAMAALRPVVPGVAWLSNNPLLVLAVAALAATAGALFQLFVRPAAEVVAAQRAERARARRRASGDLSEAARWSKHGKKA